MQANPYQLETKLHMTFTPSQFTGIFILLK